jgi:hypothetical protein
LKKPSAVFVACSMPFSITTRACVALSSTIFFACALPLAAEEDTVWPASFTRAMARFVSVFGSEAMAVTPLALHRGPAPSIIREGAQRRPAIRPQGFCCTAARPRSSDGPPRLQALFAVQQTLEQLDFAAPATATLDVTLTLHCKGLC